MAILHSCCCWNNVRHGSIACGVYTLILSLLNGALTAYNLISLNEMEDELQGHSIELMSHHVASARNWHYGMLAVALLLFFSSILLIIAIHVEKQYLLLPWMATTVLMVIMDTAVLVFQCFTFGFITLNVVLLIIWLGFTMLNVYCLLCVISQYQELRAGRGTLAYLQQQRTTIIYRPAVQELHITQGPIVMSYPTSTPSGEHNSVLQPMVQASFTTGPPPSYPVYTTPGQNSPQEQGSSTERLDGEKQESPPPLYLP